jgi:hypothetical protein
MSKRRGNAEGSIYKRNYGRWAGQYLGHTVKGPKSVFQNLSTASHIMYTDWMTSRTDRPSRVHRCHPRCQ